MDLARNTQESWANGKVHWKATPAGASTLWAFLELSGICMSPIATHSLDCTDLIVLRLGNDNE